MRNTLPHSGIIAAALAFERKNAFWLINISFT